ncbi:helix-turn-helix transcriptional regulator [Actinoplanes derwentensis]|uniref:Regulatory protein, luxR family n=1 Tax=Actinoplanes derwentensis TaxID=113562 RepID=A0A1H2C974_9ACTN|nr:AAA family ATPase [Actinoplanes derwentensis]GID86531.1 hypothetical protein Ade03nite_54550 [Actinoplanes derwentensis]SDT66616.1 regulatory protein, luxR family [Actinoplanes derwentensis]
MTARRPPGVKGNTPRRRTVAGRDEQIGILGTARREAADGGRFVLVTGVPGSGRTALLEALADAWQPAGVAILRVSHPEETGAVAGFAAVLHVVREQYERLGDPLLAGPLSTIGALCADTGPVRPGRLAELSQETSAAFGLIGRRVPTVLLADDADDAPGLTAALAAAVRAGCLVVATARTARGRLAALADTVVDLPPLPADAVRDLLVRRHGVPLDEAVLPALATALGPLAGNPATVLETTAELLRTGRLKVVGGHLCLLDPRDPIGLPAGHRLVTALLGRGPDAVRLATMAAVTRFGLDDLPLFAHATLGRLDDYGWIVDALVTDGVLVADRRGSIRPQSPALAARLVADAGPAAVARLHRAYAAAMFRRAGAGAPADRAALADHVTSAGVAMPTDRRTAVSLAATAAQATDREPGRAADWLRAALWHAGGGQVADDILARLLRLLVRTGQFARLSDVVRAAGPAGRTGDLAAAATLAAVHTGTPAPEATDPAVTYLADRWLDGRPAGPVAAPDARPATLISAAEVALAARSIGAGLIPADEKNDELLTAGGTGDLATVLQLILGEARYDTPADGLLAAYHRLHACHAHGDLPGMLSAAREVDLAGAQAPAVRRFTRLWAAEALALQGRAEEAASRIAGVPDEAPYAALRWWAANGPATEPATALEAAGRLRAARVAHARQLAHGSRIGVEQLLTRAAGLAARFDLAGESTHLAGIVDADASGPHRRLSAGTTLLIRALTTGDTTAATRATGLIRARGHRPDLTLATLALGRVAPDPRPWLLEAQAQAEEIGSPVLRSAVTTTMRERGVRRPRSRSPQAAFSAVEMQTIELIRRGRTNRQIAVQVRMSEKTIENYLTRLFARTGCRSRVELAAVSLTTDILGVAS